MSELDLTAAVEAAAIAAFEAAYPDREHGEWSDLTDMQRYRGREVVVPLVAAIAPHIAEQVEAIVREQVAREIEAEGDRIAPQTHYRDGVKDGHYRAARIARGQS